MSRAIEIQTATGTIDAHVFVPEQAHGALPGVVLFTDIGGLRPCYFDKAQTIADDGYAVLMPNVYYRDRAGSVVPEGKSFRDDDVRPTLFEYAGRLTPDAQAHDFVALLGAIDADPAFAAGPVGVVGYCMTGAFALRMAANHPDRVVAAAGFHSARLAEADDANSVMHGVDRIRARVFLGHADGDALMDAAQIGRLDQAMAAAGVDFATELFAGAAHGYTAFDAPAYDEAADARHYKRLSTLFDETLAVTPG
ncbi:dienelactone hydrolase family protein [Salinisphaera sp. Q1T1-3]|uniref:dienelactone hydrolase family protein n=1 Tax=Salinisphaera sp. Q1T1-3 TaxID=2321229 RepID=UPI000E71A72C|nr:dienelactone hydrolase family protein [Salinisphaera sp. Q1T1-3]RJS91154.1 dienelactone hydrolase family protein [Salinisphaera sp. Q1T1-3]